MKNKAPAMRTHMMLIAAAAMALGLGSPAVALDDVQKAKPACSGTTPPNWNWECRNGKRVPRVARTQNPDGSWVEKVDDGKCTVRRKGTEREFASSTKCD